MKLNGKSAEWRQAETGLRQPQDREHQKSPELGRDQEGLSPEPSRDHGPYDITMRGYMYIILNIRCMLTCRATLRNSYRPLGESQEEGKRGVGREIHRE